MKPNRNHRAASHPVKQIAWASLAVCVLAAPAAWANSAEIVLLIGKGERRQTANAPWRPAALSQKVQGGESVRTLANSQMALFMPDRTQVRLNQNTELEVRVAGESASWSETLLSLSAGRAWSQARPQSGGSGDSNRRRVNITTPTATLGIRGTDWEVEVDREGRTQLVVLSGVVEMSNSFGSILVAPGEGALAEAGKAPVKRVLVSPASRIQWVSSWRPQPQRWAGNDAQRLAPVLATIAAGDYSAAVAALQPRAAADVTAAVLLADLLLHQGEAAQARAALASHAREGAGDARAVAMLAQALARDDQVPQGRSLLAAALARTPAEPGLLLAQGDLAVLDGDAAAAQAAYAAVLVREPDNAQAWYGLGLIESERENVRAARAALGEALRRAPGLGAASAELAATEALAGNLAEGRRLLQELLVREPDNYLALTALGLNRLKSGQTEEALQDFMKAGVIEPRQARAWLYSGVAFYQLGETGRAMEAFARAAQLDGRDPMPWLYRSGIEGDVLAYGDAIASARAAQQRMPFLKSLNQAASNQKGSANLGTALANFGLEDWAGYYASESYSPFWGGSHLFLADRYTGRFNKNSELFSGFLTEPTAFGASNRQSALVAAPGHHGKIDAVLDRSDWTQGALIGTLNGLRVAPTPIAYFLSADLARADARMDDSSARARNFTLGLGIQPRYDLSLFGFATDSRLDATLRSATLPSNPMEQTERRADLGGNYKIDSRNQFWLKAGRGHQRNDVRGQIVSQPTADALNSAFSTNVISPNGQLDAFDSRIEQSDLQLRHAVEVGAVQWSWGLERSLQERSGNLAMTFTPVRVDVLQAYKVRATDAYVSARLRQQGRYELQADLFHQRARLDRSDSSNLTVLLPGGGVFPVENSAARQDVADWNPRLGAKWQIAPLQSVRAVLQHWRRPASSATLSPIDTVGVALNDRLVNAGGEYRRARLQADGEVGGASFFQAFYDHERVDNGLGGRRSAIADFEVTQLEALRNRPEVFSARDDLEETPQFAQGRVQTLGLALNHVASRSQTLSLRYLAREGGQTGAGAGLDIPFVSRHLLQLGAQWAPGGRWLLGTSAVWRSARFKDAANLEPLAAGWSLGATVYWESQDKASTVQAILDNVLSDRNAGVRRDPHLLLRYGLRF